MKVEGWTHVAPETKTSTVLALVKHDTAAIRRAEDSTMTANRSAMLPSALRTTTGTRRRTTTIKAIRDRASLWITESERMDMLGSRDTVDWDCREEPKTLVTDHIFDRLFLFLSGYFGGGKYWPCSRFCGKRAQALPARVRFEIRRDLEARRWS